VRWPESFRGRAQPSQVLRIERAESCRDSRPDPDDPFFHAWPQQCDPKLAAKKELRTADGRRASCMCGTIKLHLFHRGRCIIHGVALTRSLSVVVLHLRVERMPVRNWMWSFIL